jgi:hypothetical protein
MGVAASKRNRPVNAEGKGRVCPSNQQQKWQVYRTDRVHGTGEQRGHNDPQQKMQNGSRNAAETKYPEPAENGRTARSSTERCAKNRIQSERGSQRGQ